LVEFISFIYVNRQLDEVYINRQTDRMSVADMMNVGIACRASARCRSTVLEVLRSTDIKEHEFLSFSHLRTGARTGCISATIKYCAHTNSTLSYLFYNKELCSLPDFIL